MCFHILNDLIPTAVVCVLLVANAYLAKQIFINWNPANKQQPSLDVSFWYSTFDRDTFSGTAIICTLVFWFIYSLAFSDYPTVREVLIGAGIFAQITFFMKNALHVYLPHEIPYIHFVITLAGAAFYAYATKTQFFTLLLGICIGYIVFWIASILNDIEDEREYF